MNHYILKDNGELPVLEPDVIKWGLWFESADMLVACEVVNHGTVLTRFLAIAFNDVNPHYWETRVMGGIMDGLVDRCSGKREQAEAMHARMVYRCKNQGRIPCSACLLRPVTT